MNKQFNHLLLIEEIFPEVFQKVFKKVINKVLIFRYQILKTMKKLMFALLLSIFSVESLYTLSLNTI